MPNYVRNLLIIKGDKEKIKACIESLKGEASEDALYPDIVDFNKIIPMPDTIRDTEETSFTSLYRLIYEASLNIPKELDISERNALIISAVKGMEAKDNDDLTAKCVLEANIKSGKIDKIIEDGLKEGKPLHENLVNYGSTTWYPWACKHWGTKWNAMNSEIVTWNVVSFNTAWNGVPNLIGALSKEWPELMFIYAYADEDRAGYNAANCIIQNNQGLVANFKESGGCEEFANHVWEDDFKYVEEMAKTIPMTLSKESLSDFVGYVQLYFYTTYADDSFSVSKLDCDFSNPLTEDVLLEMAEVMMRTNFMLYNKVPKETHYISKDCYEELKKNQAESITATFDENGIKVVK